MVQGDLPPTPCLKHSRRDSTPSASGRISRTQKRHLATTPNRFSLLAELDPSTNQAKWAFDFVQTSDAGGRKRGRRGKRGQKPTKAGSANQQPCEDRNSVSVSELRHRIASMCLNSRVEKPGGGPKNDSLLSSGQTIPTSSLQPDALPCNPRSTSIPVTRIDPGPPQLPPSCHTSARDSFPPPPSGVELAGLRRRSSTSVRKESRFFPLSAFITLPNSSSRRSAPSPAPSPAIMTEEVVEEAVRKSLSIAVPTPAETTATSAACRASASRKSISSPLTITLDTAHQSSSISSPMNLPWIFPVRRCPTPEYDSTIMPPPNFSSLASHSSITQIQESLPERPRCIHPSPHTEYTLDSYESWTNVTGPHTPASPASLITTPITTPNPFITLPTRCKTPHQSPPLPKPAPWVRDASPAVLKINLHSPPLRISTTQPTTYKEPLDFYAKGHANPCWCTAYSTLTLSTPQIAITPPTTPPPSPSGLDTPAPSSPPPSSGFEFEHVSRYTPDLDVRSLPSTCASASAGWDDAEDADWHLIALSPLSLAPARSPSPAREAEHTSRFHLPKSIVEERELRAMEEKGKDSAEGRREYEGGYMRARESDTVAAWRTSTRTTMRPGTSASTRAAEWPTLQEAMHEREVKGDGTTG